MANGDILDEVEELLGRKQIPQGAALRVSLKLQKELFVKFEQLKTDYAALERRVAAVENISIVNLIQRHPKIAWGVVLFFMILTSYTDVRALVLSAVAIIHPGG